MTKNKNSPSKMLKFKNLLWKLHYKLEKSEQQHTSFSKLTDDPRYRAIILASALTKTEQPDLVKLAEKIIEQEKKLDIHYELGEGDMITPQDPVATLARGNSDTWLKTASLLLLLLIITIAVYSCSPADNANAVKTMPGIQERSSTSIPTTVQSQVLAESKPTVSENIIAKPNPKAKQAPVSVEREKNIILRLHGSNTVGEKLAPTLMKAYLKNLGAEKIQTSLTADLEKSIAAYLPKQGWIDVEIHAHGSSTSFKGLDKGIADMGMSSRKIKDKEVVLLKDRLGDLTRPVSEHILGLDGLAIIVNKANPINSLDSKQLAQLFSGEITNWSELGGDNLPVSIFAREANSGTWDTFKSLVLKKHQKKLSPAASRHESSSELSDLVAENVGAIGFIGLPYVRHSKLLAVADGTGAQAIIPTLFTVGTEDYPLSRRLYFYTPSQQSAFMREFIEFSQSKLGQSIVKQIGFISQNIYTVKANIPADAPSTYRQLVDKSERLSLNLRFQSGSDTLDNKALRDLDRITDYIVQNPSKQLSLFGFSDSIGDANYNVVLAEKRARKIDEELQRRGVFANTIKGFGEIMPVASNMTKAGRNKNRRVEIWVQG